jgi:hypothetical protein
MIQVDVSEVAIVFQWRLTVEACKILSEMVPLEENWRVVIEVQVE